MTLSIRQLFEIKRMQQGGASLVSMARQLGLSVPTVRRYLQDPERILRVPTRDRPSRLEPYKEAVQEMLGQCEDVSAVVVYQRLQEKGYEGGLTVVKDHLRLLRGKRRGARTYWHFESLPGEQFQVDWGSFGSIDYEGFGRPLYCFAMVEAHSRMLFVEFTHSMKLAVFIHCHINAFGFFGGCCKTIVHDNLKSAVVERDGRLIRFNDTYLDFLMRVGAAPRACTPGAPHEKGKIENLLGYVRHNFLPLRVFKDLADVNRQALMWLKETANVRIHRTTGQRPVDRFKPEALRPIDCLEGYDSREMLLTKGPRDLRIKFDCNRYSIPFWAAGKDLVVKASSDLVTIYCGKKIAARHERCWGKYQSVVNPLHRDGMTSQHKREQISHLQELLLGMGEGASRYLQRLQSSSLPLRRSIVRLVELRDHFGSAALLRAMELALERGVLGVEYVEQLLFQITRPSEQIPRLELPGHPELSALRLGDVNLMLYDNVLIEKGKDHEEKES